MARLIGNLHRLDQLLSDGARRTDETRAELEAAVERLPITKPRAEAIRKLIRDHAHRVAMVASGEAKETVTWEALLRRLEQHHDLSRDGALELVNDSLWGLDVESRPGR